MRRLLSFVLPGLLLVTMACSSSKGVPAAVEATTTAAVAVDEAAYDIEPFCDVFWTIRDADRGSIHDNGNAAANQESWQRHIATADEIERLAPAVVKAQAGVYAELVRLRAELSAGQGYVDVANLPAAARQAFIGENRDKQQQANEMIAYAVANCGLEARN